MDRFSGETAWTPCQTSAGSGCHAWPDPDYVFFMVDTGYDWLTVDADVAYTATDGIRVFTCVTHPTVAGRIYCYGLQPTQPETMKGKAAGKKYFGIIRSSFLIDEKGRIVNGRTEKPNKHDILTGSRPDGTAFPGKPFADMTCGNWTKSSDDGAAMTGHHDRVGPSDANWAVSWNSAHPTLGCSMEKIRPKRHHLQKMSGSW